MKSNYHTHTALCHHAEGNVEDYVKEAIKDGFQILGMSDHGPLLAPPFPRMTISEFFNVYLKEIEEAKFKFKNQIKIYSGLEMEYLTSDLEYLQELRKHVDYLILGPHYFKKEFLNKDVSSYRVVTKENLYDYRDMMVEAINTKLFKIIAHPDIFMTSYQVFDEDAKEVSKEIIEAAMQNDCILEVNANGYRSKRKMGYPCKEFFMLAKEMNAKIMIGLDAHKPEELNDQWVEKTYEFAAELGLDIIEEVDF